MFVLEREPRRSVIAASEAIGELKSKARRDAGQPVKWSKSLGVNSGSYRTPEGKVIYRIRKL